MRWNDQGNIPRVGYAEDCKVWDAQYSIVSLFPFALVILLPLPQGSQLISLHTQYVLWSGSFCGNQGKNLLLYQGLDLQAGEMIYKLRTTRRWPGECNPLTDLQGSEAGRRQLIEAKQVKTIIGIYSIWGLLRDYRNPSVEAVIQRKNPLTECFKLPGPC